MASTHLSAGANVPNPGLVTREGSPETAPAIEPDDRHCGTPAENTADLTSAAAAVGIEDNVPNETDDTSDTSLSNIWESCLGIPSVSAVHAPTPASAEDGVNAPNLPHRLFATDRYPADCRINSYSKPDHLLDLVELLDGSEEFEWLKSTCFGRLFKLPIRRSSLSGKLVHQFLCRSLVTKKKHEIWFVYGGQPIRFSLREFGILTGLNCEPFPPASVTKKMKKKPKGEEDDYFNTLIGPNKTYSIQEVVDILRRDKRLTASKRMCPERRKRLALLVIVDGILVCKSSRLKASKKVARMLKDVDAFLKYPWGRKSFKRTVQLFTIGKHVASETEQISNLTHSHATIHGFTLAFQLLILQAIPQLEKYLPDAKDERTFADRSVHRLTLIKTFHNSNILETENDPTLAVESILATEDTSNIQDYSWGKDEVDDVAVEYMLSKIKDDHIFHKEDWLGGFDQLPLITVCLDNENKANKAPAAKHTQPKKGKAKKPCKEKQTFEPRRNAPLLDGNTVEDIMREVDRRNNEHMSKVQNMLAVEKSIYRDEIVDAVLKTLREKGVFGTSANISHSDLLASISRSAYHPTDVQHQGTPDAVNEPVVATSDKNGGGSDDKNAETNAEEPKGTQDAINESGDGSSVQNGGDSTESENEDAIAEKEQEHAGGDLLEQEVNDTVTHMIAEHVEDEMEQDTEGQENEAEGKESVEDSEGRQSEDESADGPESDGGQPTDGRQLQMETYGGQEKYEQQKDKEDQAAGKKRKDPILDQDLTPLPSKRPRRMPRRLEQCSSYIKEKKAPVRESEPEVYMPFPTVKDAHKKKFFSQLQSYSRKVYIIDTHPVKETFFHELYTPQHWVESQHMEAMLSLLWRKLRDSFIQSRIGVLDTWFSHIVDSDYARFQKTEKKSSFQWTSLIKKYVDGIVPSRSSKMTWFSAIDTIYVPMNWGKLHWVAVAINLKQGEMVILDSQIKKNDEERLSRLMQPLASMLPIMIREFANPEDIKCTLPKSFKYTRLVDVYQNDRTGDSGPLAVKFIELHAKGLPLDGITDTAVDDMRMKFAFDIYDKFVTSLSS